MPVVNCQLSRTPRDDPGVQAHITARMAAAGQGRPLPVCRQAGSSRPDGTRGRSEPAQARITKHTGHSDTTFTWYESVPGQRLGATDELATGIPGAPVDGRDGCAGIFHEMYEISGRGFCARKFRTAVPPYRRTAVPPYRRTAVPPYRRTAVPPYRRTAVPPYRRTAVPPCRAAVPCRRAAVPPCRRATGVSAGMAWGFGGRKETVRD
jgi:hypothetical protein